ncbi:MAG: hypothetical protein GXY51_10745 [Bacteroidetes bacterium]|nr:hypothetical protein [Bacteroidota bacterium]
MNTKTQYYNNHLHVGSPDKSGGYHTIKTNYYMMKNIVFITSMFFFLLSLSCSKEEKSERFRLLTTPVWETDSLLVNGVDASGPGEMLADFAGEARFNEDGTGTFGNYTGEWKFSSDEQSITIFSDDLPYIVKAVTCDIIELTTTSFKIEAVVPDQQQMPVTIRLTFKAK